PQDLWPRSLRRERIAAQREDAVLADLLVERHYLIRRARVHTIQDRALAQRVDVLVHRQDVRRDAAYTDCGDLLWIDPRIVEQPPGDGHEVAPPHLFRVVLCPTLARDAQLVRA